MSLLILCSQTSNFDKSHRFSMSSIMLIKESSILYSGDSLSCSRDDWIGPNSGGNKGDVPLRKFKFSSLKIGYHKIPFSRYVPESCFLIGLGIGKLTSIPDYLVHACLFSSCKPEFPGSRGVHLRWGHSYLYCREILQHPLASYHFGCVVHPLWQVLHFYVVIFLKEFT